VLKKVSTDLIKSNSGVSALKGFMCISRTYFIENLLYAKKRCKVTRVFRTIKRSLDN
jgi:hypothetical protein